MSTCDPLLKAILSTTVVCRRAPSGFHSATSPSCCSPISSSSPITSKEAPGALQCPSDAFLAQGGEARFNCGAQKIITSGGRVTGVETEQGDTVKTRYVLSNASMLQTYLDLMDSHDVPKETLEGFRSTSIGPSAFSIYMGFDCEPGEIGIEETTNFITTTTDMDEAFARWKTLEQQGVALLTCYDVSDPDFSPPGTCQAAFVTLQYGDPWYLVPPHQYYDTKYRYAEGMMSLAEKVFPGIRGHIEEMEIATPMTHLRYLGHLGGAIYGHDQYTKDTQYFMATPLRSRACILRALGLPSFQPTHLGQVFGKGDPEIHG